MNAFENALFDYWKSKKNTKFKVYSSLGDVVQYDAAYFYRDFTQMPDIEKLALSNCVGKTLDLGAGVGAHATYLQEKGISVTAMEASVIFSDIMRERGILNIVNKSFYDFGGQKFDTIISLMNGLGMAKSLENLPFFLKKIYDFLNFGGSFITDSADIAHLFDDKQDISNYEAEMEYYGNIEYTVKYKNLVDNPFPWLFCGFEKLKQVAPNQGFEVKLLKTGNLNSYLAELKKMG